MLNAKLERHLARPHALGIQGYCFGFLLWILYKNQRLRGWLAIVQKFGLVQCFGHLFLKYVLQICNQFWPKTLDLINHFETNYFFFNSTII